MGNEIPHSAFPNPHSIRVVFPSPDCNPGVRKYWGGDERFDSFTTHFQVSNGSELRRECELRRGLKLSILKRNYICSGLL